MKFQLYLIFLGIGLTLAVNEELHNANINFQQQLAHVLTKTNPDKNLLFSPLSLHTVLSLLSQGSVRSTLEDLTHVLNITNVNARNNYKSLITDINNVKGITLDMANKIYVKDNYKLNDEFKNIAVNNYFADVENINFVDNVNAANSINKWVESKTDNEIKDLIQSADLDEDTRMVLINAIYFKGVWMNQFNKTDTKKDNFYITANDKIEVDMMYQEATLRYKEITDIDAKVVEIPYVSRGVSFIILLPNKRDGLKDLEEKLKTYDVKTITRYMFPEIVKIWLPKFKMETTIDLNEPLKEMGLERLFKNADLDNLLQTVEPLKVTKVIQKAFIEVNEEGARAGVATGAITGARSGRVMSNVDFRVDHPFLFAITYRHQQKFVPIFSGKVVKV